MTEEERRRAAAARQARYRVRRQKHDAGDHSECLPASCDEARAATVYLDATGANEPDADGGDTADDAAGDVTRDVTPTPKRSASHREPPADLGPRGLRLWTEMAGLKLGPLHVYLLERACRKADRLEAMDAQYRGSEWLRLVEVPNTDGAVVQLVVDKLLSEMRQTEIALKLDVAELRHAGRAATAGGGMVPPTPTGDGSTEEEGGSGGKRRGLAAIRGGLDTTG